MVESPVTLWEAYKTVIKGQELSLVVGYKIEKKAQLESLEQDLLQMEQQLAK